MIGEIIDRGRSKKEGRLMARGLLVREDSLKALWKVRKAGRKGNTEVRRMRRKENLRICEYDNALVLAVNYDMVMICNRKDT